MLAYTNKKGVEKMKAKNDDGSLLTCTTCKREQTANECQIHKDQNVQGGCYFCHLQMTHMVEFKEDKGDEEVAQI